MRWNNFPKCYRHANCTAKSWTGCSESFNTALTISIFFFIFVYLIFKRLIYVFVSLSLIIAFMFAIFIMILFDINFNFANMIASFVYSLGISFNLFYKGFIQFKEELIGYKRYTEGDNF